MLISAVIRFVVAVCAAVCLGIGELIWILEFAACIILFNLLRFGMLLANWVLPPAIRLYFRLRYMIANKN